ncbi:hypothetical protein LTR66_017256, partial [Elasticomyces elasticus]
YNRPSWTTGLFIALACIVAAVAGVVMFKEGKKVKRVEGVPPKPDERLQEDLEKGVEMEGRSKGGRK